jgi:hypothetical protein
VKASLKLKVSLGLTSRPFGCFVNMRNFPHASDCSVRTKSGSLKSVADLIS